MNKRKRPVMVIVVVKCHNCGQMVRNFQTHICGRAA